MTSLGGIVAKLIYLYNRLYHLMSAENKSEDSCKSHYNIHIWHRILGHYYYDAIKIMIQYTAMVPNLCFRQDNSFNVCREQIRRQFPGLLWYPHLAQDTWPLLLWWHKENTKCGWRNDNYRENRHSKQKTWKLYPGKCHVARTDFPLSFQPFLSSIATSWSSRLHPVSAQIYYR